MLGAQDRECAQQAASPPCRARPSRTCTRSTRPRTAREAERALDRFAAKYGAKHDKAAVCLSKDRESLLAFYDMLDLTQGRLFTSPAGPACTPSVAARSAPCAGCSASRTPPSPYLFTTERHSPMTAAGFRKQLAVIGRARAKLPFPSTRTCCAMPAARARPRPARHPRHPGMARPPQHPATTRYTELSVTPATDWIARFSEPERWQTLALEDQIALVLNRFPAETVDQIAAQLPRPAAEAGWRTCHISCAIGRHHACAVPRSRPAASTRRKPASE